MHQLNVRLPRRLAEEFSLACQLNKCTQQQAICELVLHLVRIARSIHSLPEINPNDLMTDTPKPTESTL